MPGGSALDDAPQPAARAHNAAGWLDLPRGWLFEHIPDAVLVADLRTGRLELANPAADRLFGFSAVGESVDQVVPGLLESSAWRSLVADPSAGEPSLASVELSEVSLSRLDERYALILLHHLPERSTSEPLGSALAIQSFLDHATRELTRSLDYDTTLQAAARLGVPRLADACVIDMLGDDHAIERVAAAHVDLEAEARLLDLADSYPRPAQAPPIEAAFEALLEGGPRCFERLAPADWQAIAPDPAHAEVLASLGFRSADLVPLVVRGRLLGGMLFAARTNQPPSEGDLAVAQDLARRCALAIDNARLYGLAQQAIAARDRFVSIASHELRAPLTRLKSHAEVLLLAQADGQLDPDRLAWSVRRINAAADRLGALAKDLLDVSRLRGAQLPFQPAPLDLARLLSDLVPRFADQLDATHPLVLELAPEPTPVLVDHDRVEQVLGNLLDNAAKYSPDGGEIRVRLEPSEGGVLLSVRDQGVGLPPGSAELIFEPFGRAANAADWNVPGLGLGLHICRIIVERHGGRIWATSDGEGRGTSVWVWLPLASRSSLPRGDIHDRLTNQLTVAVGYCELLASHPALPPQLRAMAREAMHGAQQAAAVLESVPGVFPAWSGRPGP